MKDEDIFKNWGLFKSPGPGPVPAGLEKKFPGPGPGTGLKFLSGSGSGSGKKNESGETLINTQTLRKKINLTRNNLNITIWSADDLLSLAGDKVLSFLVWFFADRAEG